MSETILSLRRGGHASRARRVPGRACRFARRRV